MQNSRLPAFIVTFLLAWALYFVGVALLPASSLFSAVAEALLLQVIFVLLVGIGGLVTWVGSTATTQTGPFSEYLGVKQDIRLRLASRLGLALSVAGLIALFADKVFIQGVDYFAGVAAARAQWTDLGADREHVSSIWSAVGYLLSSSFFVSVSILIWRAEAFSTTERMVSWALSLWFVLANSALTGGRSILLLLSAFVVALIGLRFDLGKSFRRIGLKSISAAAAALVLGGGYALYVFAARAELTEVDAHRYAVEMLEFLGAEPTPAFERLSGDGWAGQLVALLTLALAYVVHSLFTFAAILELPPQHGHLLFGYWRELAAKLGLTEPPELDWPLTGRFPSLPGALYLDGGVGLLVVVALALGVLMALTVRLCQRHPASLTALSVWAAVQTTALISPLLPAAELLSYPFVIAEFMLIAAAASAIRLRSKPPTIGRASLPRPSAGLDAG